MLSVNKMEKHSVNFFFPPSLPSPPRQGGLMCRDKGWITACLGEAWHKTGCRWHDEPQDCWQILVMSLPALDSSDTLAWGTGKTRTRRSCWGELVEVEVAVRQGKGLVGEVGGGRGAAWWEETLVRWLRGSSVFFNVPTFISSRSCQR